MVSAAVDLVKDCVQDSNALGSPYGEGVGTSTEPLLSVR